MVLLEMMNVKKCNGREFANGNNITERNDEERKNPWKETTKEMKRKEEEEIKRKGEEEIKRKEEEEIKRKEEEEIKRKEEKEIKRKEEEEIKRKEDEDEEEEDEEEERKRKEIEEREKEEEDQFISCYINSNVKNVEDVEKHLEKIENEINELNNNIMKKVEKQITYKSEYENLLKNIKNKMGIIKSKVDDVDRKRDESEEILKKLCKDVKVLDIGKKNVTITIIILKRVVMIITAISSLKKKALRREYKDCIPLISVIKEMLIVISNLKTNEKLQNLFKDVHILFNDLKNQIKEDIDLIYDNDVHIENNIVTINEMNNNVIQINLYDACNCLYYLNSSFINVIVNKFVTFSLEKYILIFENQQDSLETIDRRIAWLKRCLNNYENKYACIFPPIFNIPFRIVKKFCTITKKQLLKFMSSSIEEMDPVLLIKAVIKVINFEKFLEKNIKFVIEEKKMIEENFSSLNFPFPELIMKYNKQNIKEEKTDGAYFQSEGITQKSQSDFLVTNKRQNIDYVENEMKEEMKEEKANVKLEEGRDEVTTTVRDRNTERERIKKGGKEEETFKGSISCIFDNYLCSWLKYEEKKILLKYEEIIKENEEDGALSVEKNQSQNKKNDIHETLEEKEVNHLLRSSGIINKNKLEFISNEQYTVYKSACKLFHLYKNYIDMILLFSNCQTLYDFVIFFKSLLSKYAEELNKKIVKKIKEENKTTHFKMLSILMNTSYYVEQSINEAYESLLINIDPIYKDVISFKEEEKLFLNIKSKCIKLVVDYMEQQINNILSNNCIINIYDINKIKEKSLYIMNVKKFLHYYFSFFKNIFNEIYLTYLLEKITTLIIQRFYHVIFSLEFLSDVTAQQLLLDCYELKEILFRIPQIWDVQMIPEENRDVILKGGHDRKHKKTDEVDSTNEQNKMEENLLLQTDESIIPQSYFNYIKNQMNKIEFLIKIFLSDIYDLDTFSSLLTENNNICTIAEIEKMLSLKEKKNENMQSALRLNKSSVYDFTKKGKQAAGEVKLFLNKIANM